MGSNLPPLLPASLPKLASNQQREYVMPARVQKKSCTYEYHIHPRKHVANTWYLVLDNKLIQIYQNGPNLGESHAPTAVHRPQQSPQSQEGGIWLIRAVIGGLGLEIAGASIMLVTEREREALLEFGGGFGLSRFSCVSSEQCALCSACV